MYASKTAGQVAVALVLGLVFSMQGCNTADLYVVNQTNVPIAYDLIASTQFGEPVRSTRNGVPPGHTSSEGILTSGFMKLTPYVTGHITVGKAPHSTQITVPPEMYRVERKTVIIVEGDGITQPPTITFSKPGGAPN